jgi:uncharacterized membrane protein
MRAGDWTVWGLVALLSVGVGGYGLFHVVNNFETVPPSVLKNGFFTPLGVELHIAFSAVALMVGAFQFLQPLRRRAPGVHRWIGRIYVAACTIGGLSGGAIALYSSAGLVAGWGFFCLALLWVPFTLLGLATAMRRDFVAHERWMIRSFALTFGAVTLRFYLPLALGPMGLSFQDAYPAIAWLAWVPNLILVEIWLRARTPRPRSKGRIQTPA